MFWNRLIFKLFIYLIFMKKNLANAVKLPSSNRIFGRDNGDFEKNILVSLLNEAYKRKLLNKTKIIVSNVYMTKNAPNNLWDYSDYFELKKSQMNLAKLKKLYRNTFGVNYSPEFEEERKRNEFAALEKEGEKVGAWGSYLYLGRLENEKEELKKIAKEKGFQYSL